MAKPAVVDGKPKVVKKRAPENETPRERFKRVANTRVNNVIDGLRLLTSMGPSKEYEFTPDDATKIVKLIDEELEKVEEALTKRKAPSKVANLFD